MGATLFGSGYVLTSYLQGGLADRPNPWLTQQQVLDAVVVGQMTPGPLLTAATFVGYVRGQALFGTTAGAIAGALLATAAIFLPAFLFVAVLSRVLPRLRAHPLARGTLDAMNAAVVALIFVVAGRFSVPLWPSPTRMSLAAACLVTLLVTEMNSTWLLLIAGVIGVGGHLMGWR